MSSTTPAIPSPSTRPGAHETVRVLTLNIWNRMGPWEARLAAIRAGLAELAPDVVGLQEVLALPPGEGDGLDQARAVAAGLGYHVAYGRSPEQSPFGMGNAVLSRWPILASHAHALPKVGTDEARCVVHAEIDAPFGRFPFFVTHLNWKFDEGHVREAQVREVVRHVTAARAVDFPAVLVGDFNAEPDADEIRYLRGLTTLGTGRSTYFWDAFGLAGEGFAPTFTRDNPFAAIVEEPSRRIDYVFVRPIDDRPVGQPLRARVCFDRALGSGGENGAPSFASDHLGVVAELRVR